MYNDSQKFEGTCCFFFKFVERGCKTMETYLKKKGYSKLVPSTFNNKPGKRYIMFTGEESTSTRDKAKHIFNSSQNCNGEFCKYIILSTAGAVGITLKNVRFLGIGAVDFNYSTLLQIMGRVNRLNSHIDLPVSKRTLENRLYIAVRNEKYYKKHKLEIDQTNYRSTYKYPGPGLCIERILYQDSIFDDIELQKYRDWLKKIGSI
jgi:hypothetical protein